MTVIVQNLTATWTDFRGRFQALTAVAPAVKRGLNEPYAENRLPPLIGFGGPVRMGADIAAAFAPTSVHMRATRMGTRGVHKVSHRKPGSRRRSWLPRRAKTVLFVSIILVQGT